MPYLHPGWLFEQACAMDPTAETFLQWTGWAEKHGKPADAEGAAEAWKKALPQDPRPLLRLMRYAEDRDALKKALGYLRQAEALDGVSSEVRRARLRLLLLGAVRHLKQGKRTWRIPSWPNSRRCRRPARTIAPLSWRRCATSTGWWPAMEINPWRLALKRRSFWAAAWPAPWRSRALARVRPAPGRRD